MTTLKFYVYVYLRRDGSPYYVGKGQNARWRAHHRVEVPPPERVIFLITNTTEEWAHFIEMEFIDKHGRLNDGTGILENWTDGGEGTSGLIRGPMSEEARRKISEARKGQPMSEETKRKISENNGMKGKGKPRTEETKKKISDAKKGKPGTLHTEETKQKISDARKGKPHTEETKQKISEAQTGEKNGFYHKTHSEETKQKIKEAWKTRAPMTEETKQKISDAMKSYYDPNKRIKVGNESRPVRCSCNTLL